MILDIARRRRSVRSYREEEVGIEDVLYALEVARHAPSGANRQPWRFILVRCEETKRRIRSACEDAERKFHEKAPPWMKEWLRSMGITWSKPFLTEAPVLLLVFGRKTEPYWVQSVWIAIGYITLALQERGLYTLTYTPPGTRWANELLGVPDEYLLQTIMPIGRPRDIPEPMPRLELSEILFYERWGKSRP